MLRARALCQQVSETPQLFPTLRGLCRLYQARGALLTAREFGEQLLWLAQCEATPIHLLEAHGVLGATFFYLGEYATAWMHLKQGIAHNDPAAQQSQAFRHGVAPGVACLADATLTLWCLGYPVQAMRRCQEALAQAPLAHPYSLAQARHWAAYRPLAHPYSLAQARHWVSLPALLPPKVPAERPFEIPIRGPDLPTSTLARHAPTVPPSGCIAPLA